MYPQSHGSTASNRSLPFSGSFRTDLVVGDSETHSYCFIEFEDATSSSIFVKRKRVMSQWASGFEHGFSQLVDWFWKIDDLKSTSSCRSTFGDNHV